MLRWGILATGRIAHTFAEHLVAAPSCVLEASASRDPARASSFAGRHGGRAAASYEALIEDASVDAVYIATPHPAHAEWAIRAAEAGKHVLCEKPLTMHYAHAEAVVEAARKAGVFLMEAFMYRCHPQTDRLVSLVASGVIGDVRVIEAVHSFRGPEDPGGRLLSNELGGGGILDVGCYCMSGARLVAGAALGRPFADPVEVHGVAHLGATGVDLWATGAVKFEGGIVAHLSTGVLVDQPAALLVHGSEGSLSVRNPWLPGHAGRFGIEIRRRGREPETVEADAPLPLYAYEAEIVAGCVASGVREAAAMSWEDTLGNMRALDRWRRACGVEHVADAAQVPARGRLRRAAAMPGGSVHGVSKPVSRIVLGTMVAEPADALAASFGLFDAYVEAGGKAFDTAYVYGRGRCERTLGAWLRSRRVREDVVVIAKGAHTPECRPERVRPQLEESLDRLGTSYADLYFLHRDDVTIPASEFVDALEDVRRDGLIHAYGGSNWTAARIDEANAYARSASAAGFTALSNQFSLARMFVPTYGGTVGANDPAFRAWLAASRMPNFAWSSQASGFFAGLEPGGFLAHAWFDDARTNVERRRRAGALADELGVEPVTVALAWVLHQPLDIFPIVGPRLLRELRTTLDALDVKLDASQVEWLDS